MTRVLVVHNRYLQAGGEDAAVAAETALLRARGHDVHLYEQSNETMLAHSWPTRAAETVWNGGQRAQLAELCAQTQPDVVHFHNTFPFMSPAVHYAPAHSAVVQTLHNYRMVCVAATLLRDQKPCQECVGKTAWRGVMHGCYRQSRTASLATAAMMQTHRALGTWTRKVDAFIALTPFARDVFVRGGLPVERIHIKPNFVADAVVRVERGDHFLFMGRLEEGKGLRTLLQAWRDWADAPRLRIIGSGPLQAEVTALAAQNSAVEYRGQVTHEQALQELQQARALIFPVLWYENFPLSLCEAMAAGCPIIASDVGNINEIVRHGQAALLFEPGNAQALREAVQRATRDDALLAALRQRGRQEYEAHYTPELNYQSLIGIYEQALSPKLVTV